MTTVMPETHPAPAKPSKGKKPKAGRKTPVAPRRADVAPAKGKRARKPPLPKKRPQGRALAAPSKAPRDGSKTARILDLLKRPGGVTTDELMKATGWLPHSVRGFLSGTVRKKMRLTVTSSKGDDGERIYSVEA